MPRQGFITIGKKWFILGHFENGKNFIFSLGNEGYNIEHYHLSMCVKEKQSLCALACELRSKNLISSNFHVDPSQIFFNDGTSCGLLKLELYFTLQPNIEVVPRQV